jgi:hypothetical protein
MWLFKFMAARTALIYVTVGALTMIWAGVWYVYLYNNPPVAASAYYWCSGFVVTGLAVGVIGLVLGMVSAQPHADLPIAGAPVAVVNPQPDVATIPAPVPAPLGVISPAVPSGQVVVAPPS